jgi:hypothetical protein
MSAFDGTDKPFREPSYTRLLVILVLIVLAAGLVWAAISFGFAALDEAGVTPPPARFLPEGP